MTTRAISDDVVYRVLGLRLPPPYLSFLSQHFKDTDDDPSNHCCWKSGFGNLTFVVGTTEAFRSHFLHFPHNLVIIGYVGAKKVVVNHQETEVDLFTALDVTTSEVFFVDTFGNIEKVSADFETWIRTFISWMGEQLPPHKESFLRRWLHWKGVNGADGR